MINIGVQTINKCPIGDKSSVIRLLQYGAKIDEESPDGNTALMFAVNKGEYPSNEEMLGKKQQLTVFSRL